MKIYINHKRITKHELAKRIEKLPGNLPSGFCALATLFYDHFSAEELVRTYNEAIKRRKLEEPLATIIK